MIGGAAAAKLIENYDEQIVKLLMTDRRSLSTQSVVNEPKRSSLEVALAVWIDWAWDLEWLSGALGSKWWLARGCRFFAVCSSPNWNVRFQVTKKNDWAIRASWTTFFSGSRWPLVARVERSPTGGNPNEKLVKPVMGPRAPRTMSLTSMKWLNSENWLHADSESINFPQQQSYKSDPRWPAVCLTLSHRR